MAKQTHAYAKDYSSTKNLKNFSSDNKYRNVDELKNLEEELKELEGGDPNTQGGDESPRVEDQEDGQWKKRYSDLRSHFSKKENEYKTSIQHLQGQIDQINKVQQTPKYPKTEEEVKEWIEKYPDVAAIVQTIAGQTTETMSESIKRDLAVLRAKTQEQMFKEAYSMLLSMHPDFDKLKDTEDFKLWMAEQPSPLQDSIYKPSLDEAGVKAAARVIDLYKSEKGLSKKKTPAPNATDTARAVTKSNNNSSLDADNSKGMISESQIAAMSDREYEAREKEILEAQRTGKLIYDISGAAR